MNNSIVHAFNASALINLNSHAYEEDSYATFQVPIYFSNYNCKSCWDNICLTGSEVGGITQQQRRVVLISNGVAHGLIKKVSRARAPLVDGTNLQTRL